MANAMTCETKELCRHRQWLRVLEAFIFTVLYACAGFVIIPVAFVTVLSLVKGGPGIDWTFLTQPPQHRMLEGGIMPAIVGTLYLVLGSMLIAVPIAVAAAIYLSEYAGRGRIVRLIRLAIFNLAGVPSVVYGLFGLALFVMFMRLGTSLIAGCLTLGLMALPIIITASEEALRQVPESFRSGSLALGATKWQTIQRVVLPNALPGILTAIILAIGRVAGETAPILFTCAAFYLPKLPTPMSQVMALPYHLYAVATQLPNAPDRVTWGTALVLLALVLLVNLAAILYRAHIARKRKAWA